MHVWANVGMAIYGCLGWPTMSFLKLEFQIWNSNLEPKWSSILAIGWKISSLNFDLSLISSFPPLSNINKLFLIYFKTPALTIRAFFYSLLSIPLVWKCSFNLRFFFFIFFIWRSFFYLGKVPSLLSSSGEGKGKTLDFLFHSSHLEKKVTKFLFLFLLYGKKKSMIEVKSSCLFPSSSLERRCQKIDRLPPYLIQKSASLNDYPYALQP